MTRRKKYWIAGTALVLAGLAAAAFITAAVLAKRFEPMVREQAIQYLQDRFHADVQLEHLGIRLPKIPPIKLLITRGHGAPVRVEAQGLSMRFHGAEDLPPLFKIRKLDFQVDLGMVTGGPKTVDFVTIDGMEINVPPGGRKPQVGGNGNGAANVLINHVRINNALLRILPKDKSKSPLPFHIAHLALDSIGPKQPMRFDAGLTIPKPPGAAHVTGTFGPWNADEPGDTTLAGKYTFDNADLGVFKGIGGILASSGDFGGSLAALQVRGQATVPDFHLDKPGTPVPLATQFEVVVDGRNGNTILRPVHAKLGSTNFTTNGAVIKHEAERRRSISLKVNMPNGELRDVLRLAAGGPPFMEGRIELKTKIDIPPLDSRVKQKLILDGEFKLRQARFLRANVQDQIDKLSRRGQGQPKNPEIDNVVSNMNGRFRMGDQVLTFRSLSFEAPGARVQLHGDYDMRQNALDFHGTLKLRAKVSQTMTGWKRWALKPADPFFSKNGAGTFLRIKVEGSSDHPEFGLDRGGDKNKK